ncbi:hypothetical protein DCAR_0728322 [Daucus carota subsp. sativus]|uniref:Exocyst subunit Exo70 family protein n=1 Tax=Daucus carota subsp. sativus TaxID=79200 RepID=A0A161ZK98_DAUCS|nr:PREDICTED: exocyst complex component EXO70B1 [Daucus carota subsp. sativus]WOH08871.1 hypothetical protein DCAR_0728322 [Daucus carota subsp. sativus]
MEKNQSGKFGSFTRINGYKKNDFALSPKTPSPRNHSAQDDEILQESHTHTEIVDTEDFRGNVQQLSAEIDEFLDALSSSPPPDVPDSVEALSKLVESRIALYTTSRHKFGLTTTHEGEEEAFIASVKQIYKLTNAFTEFSSDDTNTSLNRTSAVLQKAMMFIEDAFWNLLEDSRKDCCLISKAEEDNIEKKQMEKLYILANTMVCSGYETECQQVYTLERRTVFKDELEKLGFEKYNIEHIQKMNWDLLEGEIARWSTVVKHCSTDLLPRERKLVDSVFSDYPSISWNLFANLARTVLIQLLGFAEAVAITKSSTDKLFKFLDMYETLRDLIPAVSSDSGEESENELKSEIENARDRIGQAAVNSFTDLENSIKNDVAKTPVPGGAVHPLTRYVMNYLKYACEFNDALKDIFEKHTKFDSSASDESSGSTSPFSQRLVQVMDLLDANLEAKSKLYKDPSLCYIFLMNNGRYILQKAKGTAEIHLVMGDTWCRKRSTVVRHYHKSYQRDTWGRLLQCISLEGLQQGNGRVSKTVLKEKFKNFNTMFDEIHKTQSTWIVSDEQLLSELRASISAVVTPAYRSFLGRYRHVLDGSRSHVEKYIKYQPEDIETLIEELFEGNALSMARRR